VNWEHNRDEIYGFLLRITISWLFYRWLNNAYAGFWMFFILVTYKVKDKKE
jgi:hypothetical protein